MTGQSFERVAVLGTGLVGGSFALAVRAASPGASVTGWDRVEVLETAVARGVITRATESLTEAVASADLVYVALPISAALELLPEIARAACGDALVTDACSTKAAITRAAGELFRNGPRFLGGHPVTGREVCGIEHADAALLRRAKYALVGDERDPRCGRFVGLLAAIGAEPVWIDAETHDWALGIVSHLPQLATVALAGVLQDETDETGLPLSLAGPGLRDALRLAGSPYAMWRDVAATNTGNIARALDRLAQAIDHLRRNLTTRALQEQFEAANQVYKSIRQVD